MYSNWDNAADKERARQELRDARTELLKKAEFNSKIREDRNRQSKLRGDDQWMLPAVENKIKKMTSSTSVKQKKLKKESKKSKKESKKSKKGKKSKKRKKNSSTSEDNSSEEEVKIKRRKKKRKDSTSTDSSSDSEESNQNNEEWVEKSTPLVRDDWLSGMSLMSYTKEKKEEKKERKSLDTYDPSKCNRELNPYWKDGGTGVPTFKKPTIDSDEDEPQRYKNSENSKRTANWKKKNLDQDKSRERTPPPPSSSSSSNEASDNDEEEKIEKLSTESQPPQSDFLTDQQMNELGAKLIKAEILGNNDLVTQLKEKLDRAREYRNNYKAKKSESRKPIDSKKDEDEEYIQLTKVGRGGMVCPLEPKNPYASTSRTDGRKKQKDKKIETHVNNERVRFFHDDDKYNLKQMFEKEKFATAEDGDIEFAKIISKHKNPNDDLEDIFSDNVRKNISDERSDERERNDAIREHQATQKILDNCPHCFDSRRMEKQLIVAMGQNVYLSLPAHEGLQTGHCIISPMQHITCSTQLDEDVWTEVNDFRKAITRMFAARKMDVVFFETARYLNRRPHMTIHCVPNRDFELLPFYFKKAIQESESEWAHNKQLISLGRERKDLRRSIPKGLPYFWVNFGMESGFAHVIEDQERFPANFAQEVIGGLLNLNPRLWRHPRKELDPITKVKQFGDWWKGFDITST